MVDSHLAKDDRCNTATAFITSVESLQDSFTSDEPWHFALASGLHHYYCIRIGFEHLFDQIICVRWQSHIWPIDCERCQLGTPRKR